MKSLRLLPAIILGLFACALAITPGGGTGAGAKSLYGIPVPPPDTLPNPQPEKDNPQDPQADRPAPGHLTHPCSGMYAEPPFSGLSPLAISHVAGSCSFDPYGDTYTWQANGHDYVALSGFGLRMFYLFNVDDPYNPQLLYTMPFPSGGSAGTSVYPWKQGNNYYVSGTMRGTGTGCGFFVYNVNNPSSPTLVGRKTGADWCTPHEQIISTDANGDADYAWLSMSGESGSGYKVVAINLQNLPTMTETGRYQRPDSGGSIFVHDSNVVGNRVFVGHWSGGMLVFDKNTLANNINPAPLSPLNGIRPSSFMVHHTVPTSDGNHVFIEDEFISTPGVDKIKLYNISNIAAPYFETGIPGTGVAASNKAHNMRIKNVSPGHDLLFVGWYQAGTKVFSVDTTTTPPTIVEVASHQLRQSTTGAFGNVWGVDYLPCTVRGISTTCMYSGDMRYGLIVDALGYNPSLDPYNAETQITDPVGGQNITTCSYTIRGTAHDYYSGVASIEVSTNNGATWLPATGTTNWTYNWTITGNGSYILKARAIDVAGNIEVPTTSVTVNATGSCAPLTPTPTHTPINTPTNIPTSTPTPTSVLVGHVTWQGRPAQPDTLQQLPVTLTLKSGTTEVNYPVQTTDASGFFTVSLGTLATGTYDWRAKGPKYLSRAGTVALSGASTVQLEIGLMLAGDCNDDDVVNISDFNILKSTFGLGLGDPDYDERADFSGDDTVTILDFNLQRGNFGTSGSPPLRPSR